MASSQSYKVVLPRAGVSPNRKWCASWNAPKTCSQSLYVPKTWTVAPLLVPNVYESRRISSQDGAKKSATLAQPLTQRTRTRRPSAERRPHFFNAHVSRPPAPPARSRRTLHSGHAAFGGSTAGFGDLGNLGVLRSISCYSNVCAHIPFWTYTSTPPLILDMHLTHSQVHCFSSLSHTVISLDQLEQPTDFLQLHTDDYAGPPNKINIQHGWNADAGASLSHVFISNAFY